MQYLVYRKETTWRQTGLHTNVTPLRFSCHPDSEMGVLFTRESPSQEYFRRNSFLLTWLSKHCIVYTLQIKYISPNQQQLPAFRSKMENHCTQERLSYIPRTRNPSQYQLRNRYILFWYSFVFTGSGNEYFCQTSKPIGRGVNHGLCPASQCNSRASLCRKSSPYFGTKLGIVPETGKS